MITINKSVILRYLLMFVAIFGAAVFVTITADAHNTILHFYGIAPT